MRSDHAVPAFVMRSARSSAVISGTVDCVFVVVVITSRLDAPAVGTGPQRNFPSLNLQILVYVPSVSIGQYILGWNRLNFRRYNAMDSSSGEDSGFWGRKKSKIQPGDGHPLKPFRWWQMLGRTLFYAPLKTDNGQPRTDAVSVAFFNWDDRADVFLNGKHHARAKLPASIPVEDGAIEVATTLYGLKRMHFVAATGEEQVLKPDGASAEGQRAKLAQRKPGLSPAIGILAVIILLTLLPIGLLQLV